MTLSGIIYIKTKSGGGSLSRNMAGQNTFKNTPEDDLDTSCYIIIHTASKYRLQKISKIPNTYTDEI